MINLDRSQLTCLDSSVAVESEIALVELANMYAGPREPPPTRDEVKDVSVWEEDLCAMELTNEIEDIGSQYDEDKELEITDAEGEDDEKAVYDLKQEERDSCVADRVIPEILDECAFDFSESTVVSDVLQIDSAFVEEKAAVVDSLFLDEEASQSFGGMFDSFTYVGPSTEKIKEKEKMTEGKKKEKMFDEKKGKKKKKKIQPAKPERIRGKDADDDLFFVEESKNVVPKFGGEMRKLAATTTTSSSSSLAKKLPQLPQRQREQDFELERRKLDEPSGKGAIKSKTKPKGKSRDLKAGSKYTPPMAAKSLVAAAPSPSPSLLSSYASLPQIPVSAPPVSRNPFSISATTPHHVPPSLDAQPYFMTSAAFGAPAPPMPSKGFLPSAPAALSLPSESTFRYAFAPAPTPAPAAPVSPAYSLARTSSSFGSAPSPGGPPPPSPVWSDLSFGAASHSPHSIPQSSMGALPRFCPNFHYINISFCFYFLHQFRIINHSSKQRYPHEDRSYRYLYNNHRSSSSSNYSLEIELPGPLLVPLPWTLSKSKQGNLA